MSLSLPLPYLMILFLYILFFSSCMSLTHPNSTSSNLNPIFSNDLFNGIKSACSSKKHDSNNKLDRMKRLQESGSSQQKRQKLSSLPNEERMLYDLICSKETRGISKVDMRRETNYLPTNVLNKHLKALMNKSMVKEIPSIANKGIKIYLGTEFEPSKEITGGHFYTDGKLDTDFIDALKKVCSECISLQKVSTCDGCLEWVKKTGVFNTEVTGEQIEEILQTLVLDDEIMQMTSTGFEDFASIPVGKTCYIRKNKGGVRGEKKSANLTAFPCFSCQRMSFCSTDGVVSPATCVYFQKWLDF